jgi:hypothetical protein
VPLAFGLDIRRLKSLPRLRVRLISLRFKISRFFDQDGSKPRVGGFLGELEKRRHLTHEIIPAQHTMFPLRYALQNRAKTRQWGIWFRAECANICAPDFLSRYWRWGVFLRAP